MGRTLRKSGVEIVGDIPWGTHFCQFYQTQADLLDILVSYFRAEMLVAISRSFALMLQKSVGFSFAAWRC